MAIQETIELVDNASGPLEAAAGAAEDFGDAMADARASADLPSDGPEDLADSLDDASDAAEDASDAVADVGDAARSAGEQGSSAFDNLGESLQGLNAGLEIGKKAIEVGAKIAQIAAKFAGAVIEAHRFREATTAALDAVTGGRGAEALEHLSDVARDLGISAEQAAGQFVELRDAGASNADAEALIKLRADLEAVGVDAGKAGDAVKSALDRIKAGESAGDAIADVASQLGAVGDGANASAKRALTLTGALENAKNAGARAFDSIAEASGPALDRIGAKITSVLDAIEGSGQIEAFAEGFADALEYVPPIIDAIGTAWDAFAAAAGPSVDQLSDAFGMLTDALGTSENGMGAASAVGTALGYAVRGIANGIAGAVTAVAMFTTAIGAIVDGCQAAIDAVMGVPDALSGISLESIGSNLVQSFVDGMSGMLGAVISAAGGIGDAAASAIKSALGIASPSKVGLAIGDNVGESVEMGMDRSMPAEIAPPTVVDLPPVPPANDTSSTITAAAPGAVGGTVIHVTINVHPAPGASSMEIAREVRREFEAMRRAG